MDFTFKGLHFNLFQVGQVWGKKTQLGWKTQQQQHQPSKFCLSRVWGARMYAPFPRQVERMFPHKTKQNKTKTDFHLKSWKCFFLIGIWISKQYTHIPISLLFGSIHILINWGISNPLRLSSQSFTFLTHLALSPSSCSFFVLPTSQLLSLLCCFSLWRFSSSFFAFLHSLLL